MGEPVDDMEAYGQQETAEADGDSDNVVEANPANLATMESELLAEASLATLESELPLSQTQNTLLRARGLHLQKGKVTGI
ncbi:hypothetical protein BGZ75_003175 [Mortierella antarctica]|nr:hypothetical protein BGZ75_003175 [Mortierella antarctica]